MMDEKAHRNVPAPVGALRKEYFYTTILLT